MNNDGTLFKELSMGLMLWILIAIPNISQAQAISAPYNLSVVFNNDLVPIVDLIWEHNTDAFLYFLIERDGDSVGISTIEFYSESVPCFCTYCYRVYAVYDNGISEPCAPDCTFDSVPLMGTSPNQLEVELFPDEISTAILYIDNIGGVPLQYTFPDFVAGTPPPGFISDVNPASVTLPVGAGAEATVTFDATGYNAGTYYQGLALESNDPYHPLDTIPCTMHVYSQAYLSGTVTDAITSQPINGADVTASIWSTNTSFDGSYFLMVDAGTYTIYYDKPGYQQGLVADTTLSAGTTTIINMVLYADANPVSWVTADNICNEPGPSEVQWAYPGEASEIIYDDGSVEDLFAWSAANGENALTVDHYTLARMSDFDPDMGSATGIMTIIADSNTLSYVDNGFQYLPEDWYAYAVQVVYETGDTSSWNYSNIVGMDKGKILIFQIEDCLGNLMDSVEVELTGHDWPYDNQNAISDSTGVCQFDCVWAGSWQLSIVFPGYETLTMDSLLISRDTTFAFTMTPPFYPPRNMQVDTSTSFLFWEEPLITALSEDFEGPVLPSGWQMTTNGDGWFLTTNGGSSGFVIPPWNSQYICTNDDAPSTTSNDGSVDYLITPPLDLRNSGLYHLTFDSFYTGAYGHSAYVEYSYNNGSNWTVISTISYLNNWNNVDVNLSGISGPGSEYPVWLAFHSSDNGSWATGWAVDNSEIIAGPANPNDYSVYLDSALMAVTDTTFYQYYELTYGQTYTACVTANYDCGSSEMVCVDFTSGYLRPPAWIKGDTLGFDVKLSWWMDTAGITNDILGYDIYRDSIKIDYIPFNGQDTAYYVDLNPEPMCYDYYVSAVHELTTYGFNGDTGASPRTGPEEVCLAYGTQLPYFEDWSSGTFDPDWTAGDNWVVNGQIGNPEPVAEFKWDPLLTSYQSSLSSGYFNGVFPVTKSNSYIDGQFILSFDVQLDNVNATGNEKLNVDIWSEGVWNTVMQFYNADGSFGWENAEVDITENAFGKVFKIRFLANGEVSSDVLSWFVDNISIERICYPPRYLVVEGYSPQEMHLNWWPPLSVSDGVWLNWDDGVSVGGIGLTGGGVFSVASHWDPDMIAQYDGQYITQIRFVPGASVVATDFTLKVWEGPDAGTLLYEEALSGLILGSWNEITLATPVAIDVTQELWFGYTVNSTDGDFPAAYDAGPAVAGYGDMITLDGIAWDPISSLGTQFDLNWNLQAFVGDVTDGSSNPMTYAEDKTVYTNSSGILVGHNTASHVSIDITESARELTGYNIYWNSEHQGYAFLDFTEDTFYIHLEAYPFVFGFLQCYYVTAVYEDCEPASDEACWLVPIGILNTELSDEISVYPNPARDILNITSSSDITHVTVMNYLGQVVYNQKLVEDNDLQIGVTAYEAGVYMVKVETSIGIYVKKIIVVQ